MQETLIDQGFSLMLFGMGTVFVFLTILVFATSLMSKIVAHFSVEQDDISPETATALHNTAPNPQLMQAIQKAIALHRQR